MQVWLRAMCPERYDDVYPYLGHLASLPLGEELEATLRGLGERGLKSYTYRAVETLIESAARGRPQVVVGEDLHWADPTSLELLERLLSLTDRVPLLFTCVLRPLTRHGCWRIVEAAARDYPHRHTDLRLAPLSKADSAKLVRNLLHIEALPSELRERILDHAEGNPFYVEEIIRSLIDSGAIVQDEDTGHWQATWEVADVSLPDTLHGVLMARIDRLQEETKRVLQLASVIGRVFFYRVLAEIAQEERELGARLLALQREQLIRERARVPELEYVFKHELTREAAYNGLLKKERLVYHRQVAKALERLFPDRIEEQLGLLAYHWERAGETEQAIAYLRRAGEQARKQFANAEAVDHLGRALDLIRVARLRQEEADILCRLGSLYHDQGEYVKARSCCEQALCISRQIGHRSGEGNALRRLGTICERLGDFTKARSCHTQALSVYRELNDKVAQSSPLLHLSFVARRQGDYAEAQAYLEEALSIFQETEDRRGEGIVLATLGSISRDLGSYDEARVFYQQALCIQREIGDLRSEGIQLYNLGQLYHQLGNDDTAWGYSHQALLIAQEVVDRNFEAEVWTSLGHSLVGLGRLAEAADVYRLALGIRQESDQPHLIAESLCELIRISLAEGDTVWAKDHVEQVLECLGINPFLQGADQPFQVYVTCYHGLRANNDPRAQEVLSTAHRLLHERADKITDEGMRRSFLENVAAHREIVEAYAQATSTHGDPL
jgi:tetratricopeptide (TPR) repeat protein